MMVVEWIYLVLDTSERNLSAVKSKSICLFKEKDCNCHRNTTTTKHILSKWNQDCSFANVVKRQNY
jgi:hypothetical protein